MDPIYVCGPARTPIGKFGGSFADLTPADLSLPAAKAAIARAGITPEDVDEVIWRAAARTPRARSASGPACPRSPPPGP